MPRDIARIWVYRIIHFENLDYILRNGIYYRNSDKFEPKYVNIGSPEIIGLRDNMRVKCYPDTMVNDYVPFYFGVRTPMLYKIKTGHGVPQKSQEDIIYLCCRLSDLTNGKLQWCFTDGNAATHITDFFNDLKYIDDLDWRSINATEWTDNNSDGDYDRKRKKQAEFLIKDHLPVHYIKEIVVLTERQKSCVENLIERYGLSIHVHVDTAYKYYYR